MKKLMLASLVTASVLLFNVSYGSAQSITIDVVSPILNNNGVEIYNGASILLIKASSATVTNGAPSAPQLGNPFLLSGGDEILALEPGYVNPMPYFNGYSFSFSPIFDIQGLTVNSTFYVYVRVFDNIAGTPIPGYTLPPSGFDSNGVWSGATLGPIEDGVFYYDTPLYEVTVNTSFDVTIPFGTIDGDGFPLTSVKTDKVFIPPVSVPEPSAMLLMAGGLCWMFRKLKRK